MYYDLEDLTLEGHGYKNLNYAQDDMNKRRQAIAYD